LNALDKLRYRKDAEEEPWMGKKRALLVGRDLSVVKQVDLFEGLSQGILEDIAQDLNKTQWECVNEYCRTLDNGMGIIQETLGTGKTQVVSTIASAIAEAGQRPLM